MTPDTSGGAPTTWGAGSPVQRASAERSSSAETLSTAEGRMSGAAIQPGLERTKQEIN